MSTHKVEVVRISELVKHPNADSLSLVQIYGFTCIVRTSDFQVGDLCAYIEPDYVAPAEAPWAAFMKGKNRIKAKRLRGVWSQGLLIKAPEGAKEGDDVMEALGVVRWEPDMKFGVTGDAERPCESIANTPKYDLENWRRYRHIFQEGEIVLASEKVHGSNAKFAYREGRMWCGSRTQWKRPPVEYNPDSYEHPHAADIWWQALHQNPWITTWCKEHQDAVLFGEVFGQVQDLKYDTKVNEIKFRAFDVLVGNNWVDSKYLFSAEPTSYSVPVNGMVPLVYHGPYSESLMEELAVKDSKLAKHLAEGIVIKPEIERTSPHFGRVALKLVSNRYLERD